MIVHSVMRYVQTEQIRLNLIRIAVPVYALRSNVRGQMEQFAVERKIAVTVKETVVQNVRMRKNVT